MGVQDNALRLAMNAQRELAALASRSGTEKTKWFTLMGNPPLRSVMQTALGLPARIATLDLDRQLTEFQSRTEAVFGSETLAQFTDPAKRESLIRRFLSLSSLENPQATAPALTLLQAGLFRRL